MEFAYYHILQYLFGIFLGFIGMRFAYAYLKLIIFRGLVFDFVMCFLGSSLLMAAGIYLVIMPWGWETWAISAALFIAGRMLGGIVHLVDRHRVM